MSSAKQLYEKWGLCHSPEIEAMVASRQRTWKPARGRLPEFVISIRGIIWEDVSNPPGGDLQ